jgi:hypothetical protein
MDIWVFDVKMLHFHQWLIGKKRAKIGVLGSAIADG